MAHSLYSVQPKILIVFQVTILPLHTIRTQNYTIMSPSSRRLSLSRITFRSAYIYSLEPRTEPYSHLTGQSIAPLHRHTRRKIFFVFVLFIYIHSLIKRTSRACECACIFICWKSIQVETVNNFIFFFRFLALFLLFTQHIARHPISNAYRFLPFCRVSVCLCPCFCVKIKLGKMKTMRPHI